MNSSDEKEVPWMIRKWWRLALLAFAFWSVGLGSSMPTLYVLSTRGKTIEATITGGFASKPNMMTCRYEVDGNTYSTSASTPTDRTGSSLKYDSGMIGSKITVTYDPRNPASCLDRDRRGSFNFDFFSALLAILGMSLFVGYMGHLRKRECLKKIQREKEWLRR